MQHQIKKLEEISEDEKKRAQENVQRETDKFIKKIEEIAKAKEKDILTV